jgi:hypothetical protein
MCNTSIVLEPSLDLVSNTEILIMYKISGNKLRFMALSQLKDNRLLSTDKNVTFFLIIVLAEESCWEAQLYLNPQQGMQKRRVHQIQSCQYILALQVEFALSDLFCRPALNSSTFN